MVWLSQSRIQQSCAKISRSEKRRAVGGVVSKAHPLCRLQIKAPTEIVGATRKCSTQSFTRGKQMLISGPVVVMQVPEMLNARAVHNFMQELGPLLESNRPRIVLDCSQVRSIDSAGVEVLLHSLEETLKRDGDLKLAALSPEADVILELMRVARVF